jgi:transposase
MSWSPRFGRLTQMSADLFWFTDEQWSQIEPLLPINQPGPERKDDRRILSGIMHVMRSGCRWKDCPSEYGPYTTVYNRFARWSERGHWQRIFEALVGSSDPPTQAALDSSHVKVHRCAGGGKGGPKARQLASQRAAEILKSMRSSTRRAVRG